MPMVSKKVIYLDHLCTDHGVKPDPSKLSKVKDFPIPKNVNEARRFVAFANYYRRFIENFAEMARPLNNLAKKNAKFDWSQECQNSFDNLKQRLISPPLLAYPDLTKEFILMIDASDRTFGAVLAQEFDSYYRPIAYFSKNFTKGKLTKSIIEKELLAIYYAIRHFEPYLFGKKCL